jgi:hypothetical protein
MENELKNKLKEVEQQIQNVQNFGYCRECLDILVQQKEWLEGLIANFCE